MPEMLANIRQSLSILGSPSCVGSISNGCMPRYVKNADADAEPLNRQRPNHHFFILVRRRVYIYYYIYNKT